MFLETALGQYTSSGPIRAWKICPLFQGIGVATTVVVWWRYMYQHVILAWTLYYLYSSCIGNELPWVRCNHGWNTATCLDSYSEWVCINGTYIPFDKWDRPTPPEESPATFWNSWNEAVPLDDSDQCGNYPLTTKPAKEFWKIKVLGQTGTGGRGIVGHLALTLFLTWTLVYFGLWKGVKWSGKLAYFTVPFIHLVFTVLMIRGITLPGAYDGLIFYLKPDLSEIKSAEVWIAAGTEVFYSFSIGLGAFTALGSYNKFHYNSYRDSMIVAFLNVVTSIYSGIIVFSFVGYVAYTERISINEIMREGFGQKGLKATFLPPLTPNPRTTGLLLVMVKAFITSVLDLFPPWLRIGYHKEIFLFGVCVVNFLIGLSMVTKDNDDYVWGLFEGYGSGIFPLIWICFFESIAIGWFYGVRKFSLNIAEMVRWRRIEWYMKCWPATVPIIALLVWIGHMWKWPTFFSGEPLGVCMTLSSMVCIPAGMVYAVVYQLIKGEGPTMTRLKRVIQPAIVPVRNEVQPDGVEMM
eukprot:XP_011663823.1 PREDICTED: sodium- and chloride-dependent taurine transporter-like [Strongylocentrotus purpuratus]